MAARCMSPMIATWRPSAGCRMPYRPSGGFCAPDRPFLRGCTGPRPCSRPKWGSMISSPRTHPRRLTCPDPTPLGHCHPHPHHAHRPPVPPSIPLPISGPSARVPMWRMPSDSCNGTSRPCAMSWVWGGFCGLANSGARTPTSESALATGFVSNLALAIAEEAAALYSRCGEDAHRRGLARPSMPWRKERGHWAAQSEQKGPLPEGHAREECPAPGP